LKVTAHAPLLSRAPLIPPTIPFITGNTAYFPQKKPKNRQDRPTIPPHKPLFSQKNTHRFGRQ
jgi:hypothetical protein